jgi:flagellar hook-associated protein 2
MTTDPINGFATSSIYLADFGVKTGQDGSITLDKTVFEKKFEASPDAFAAIVNSRVTTESSLVSATVTGSDYKPGVYAFALDGSGNGTIAGDAMTKDGDRYTINSGDAQGVTITKTGNGASTNIFIGTSLIESLKNFSTNVLKSSADLATKLSQYRKDLTDYDDRLADLDTRIAGVRSTYAAKFAAMESAVTSLKSTETSIKNMMDSWRASLKQ